MLRYVTTNPGKVREAEEYLGDTVQRLDFDYTEIQAPELGPIAARGAREAYLEAGEPVLVDDAGLFVDDLDGFPGPYSSYVEETVGVEDVYRLTTMDEPDPSGDTTGDDGPVHRAAFRCTLAYCDGEPFEASPDPVDRDDRATAAAAGSEGDEAGASDEASEAGTDLPVKLFEGVVRGRIVAPRGEGGFGYDPIFEHEGTTLAEMTPEEKNGISHRGRALAKFAEWFAER